MYSRVIALALCFLATASLAGTNNGSAPHSSLTTWSRSARPLPYAASSDPTLRNARIPSPNGKYEITCNSEAHEQTVSASVSEKLDLPTCEFVGRGKPLKIDLAVGPEALWAPDSDAVAITHSKGGALGTYQVLIYRPEDTHAVDISSAARNDLARHYPACVGPQAGCTTAQRKQMRRDADWVNVAAIRWMEGSQRLLMMAWVPDSSDFGANLGRHMGYVVNARTGQILARYSEREFTRRFKKDCGDWGL
ncbi:MAG TPA: hypothetical protein VGL89_05295 [Candidatus Koribacter sp.]|jgi:hypothetical protein